MKVRLATLAVAGLLLGGLGWASPARADDAATAKIAVCDPTKVLGNILEGKDVVAKWKTDGEDLAKQLADKKKPLDAEAEEIKMLMPTSEQYQAKVDKLTIDQGDVQGWYQAMQLNLARQQRTQEKALFDKILAAIKDVATTKGLTLVMNSAHPDFPDLDHMDVNAFFQVVLMHTSLYSDPNVDITQAVIVDMDKAYTGPAATPAATPAPTAAPAAH